jgi:(p)ppGpp synthase/HD superfamily hydrolase
MSFPKWRAFCAQAHANVGQTYGDHPYSYHLGRVEEALMRFGFSEQAYRMAAWGHDLIEDTKETRRSLLKQGISMLTLMGIWGVTDEPGATRKARKLKTYPKIRRYRIAIIVKLADRIANVEENIRTGNRKGFEKYRDEHPVMESYLRNRNDEGAERMWCHLDWLFENGPELMRAFGAQERVVGVPL